MWIRDSLRKEHRIKRFTSALVLENKRDSNGLQVNFAKKVAEDSPTHNVIKCLKSVQKCLQAGCVMIRHHPCNTFIDPLSSLKNRAANAVGI